MRYFLILVLALAGCGEAEKSTVRAGSTEIAHPTTSTYVYRIIDEEKDQVIYLAYNSNNGSVSIALAPKSK